MSADAAPAASSSTVEHGGFVLSGSTPAAEVRESLKALDEPKGGADADTEQDPVAKAAAELGKKGGRASAAARAKAAKAAPATEPAEGESEKKPAAEARPAADDAADDDDQDDAAAAEKKSRAKARVEEATREAAKLRRENQELRERMAREEGRREGAGGAPEPERREARATGPANDEAPKLDDFLAQHDDYNAGLAAYLEARDKHRDTQREQQERGRQRAESIQTRVQTFREKVKAEGGAEFMASLSEDVQQLRPSISLQKGERPDGRTFIADSLVLHPEHSTGIMRHLSDNPRDFERIAALTSPYLVSFEVGKIVARLEGVTAGNPPPGERQESKPASKAPAPVRPVTGAPSAASGPHFRPGEDFDAWYLRTGGKQAAR